MSNAIVSFKAKSFEIEGVRYVKLVEPSPHHLEGTEHNMRQVVRAWQALFGHNGRVSENCPLVESFGSGFMPTVTVNLGSASMVSKFYLHVFPDLVDKFRAEGLGLIDSEDKAHELLEEYAISSRR